MRRCIEKVILKIMEAILPATTFDRIVIWWRRKVNRVIGYYPEVVYFSTRKNEKKYCIVRYSLPTFALMAAGIQYIFCYYKLLDKGYIPVLDLEYEYSYEQGKIGEYGIWDSCFEQSITAEEAAKCLQIFEAVQYDEIIDITDQIHVRFNDAGHMLGSSIIELWVDEDGKTTKTVFTGDIGNNDIPLLSSPTMIEDTDYLVMESTYGSRLHIRNNEKAEMFLDIVSETLDNQGTVVIPSFAVGRTQEILYELNKLKDIRTDEEFRHKYRTLMRAPVYVDSPLAISATEVFRENMDLFDEETQKEIMNGDNPLEFPGLKFTMSTDESKALNESQEPCIIISASGMCEVGRIKHHLKHNLWNPNSTILFVGYQAPGTLGYSIVHGAKKVKIFGEEIAVNARFEYIECYSVHADQEWLMNFIYSFIQKPKHIFLIHGEEESQEVLEQKIVTDTKLPVTIPDFGDTYELDKDNINLVHTLDKKLPINIRTEVVKRLEKLKEELKDMETSVNDDVNNHELHDQDIFRINEKMKELEQQILNVIEG